MGKGEIARYEQFSHSVFKGLVSQGCQKVSLCGNGLRDGQLSNWVEITGAYLGKAQHSYGPYSSDNFSENPALAAEQ